VGLSNFDNLDFVVAVSEKVYSEAVNRVSNPGKVTAIRNGVDESSLPVIEKDEGAVLRVIFVGRITHEQKGVMYLPEIVSHVVSSGGGVCFDVIGDGGDFVKLRHGLGKFILDGTVTLHGALPHDDVLDWMGRADVLLMPSHYEGQPITLFEAMMRGVVPVVSNLPGITDKIIKDGVNGFLVPVADRLDFAKRIVALGRDRKALLRMSVSARTEASAHHSSRAMADSYIDLINSRPTGKSSAAYRSGHIDTKLLGRFFNWPYFIAKRMGYLSSRLPSDYDE
jgi:glycosyltransferase involved in cell wall biosynthesis